MQKTDTSDAGLVARVLSGQRDAFGTLVGRYQDRMLSYARHMGFDEAESLDLVQDAFVRAYRHLGRCGEPERFDGWLFTIVSNLCRTAGRKRSRDRFERLDAHSASLVSTHPGPDRQAEESWTRERVRAALRDVPAEQREALVLMYMDGLSVSEIEERTGASRSAVKMRLVRGREALKRSLGPLFSEDLADERG
jgi:RNA polymerase sigma-70 factor (ECF subfamily)